VTDETTAKAILAVVSAACIAAFVWAAVATARTPLPRSMLDHIPQKVANAGDRLWRVPQYWEHDDSKDVLYDPYFAEDGLILPPHEAPKDPELARILEQIAKNAPSP